MPKESPTCVGIHIHGPYIRVKITLEINIHDSYILEHVAFPQGNAVRLVHRWICFDRVVDVVPRVSVDVCGVCGLLQGFGPDPGAFISLRVGSCRSRGRRRQRRRRIERHRRVSVLLPTKPSTAQCVRLLLPEHHPHLLLPEHRPLPLCWYLRAKP
jgi:hypothetical protein